MTKSEELDHKRVQAVYLRKLLECLNEDIAELEQVDPYAELKTAHAAGKRIAFKNWNNEWIYWSDQNWSSPAEDYKIAEDDETFEVNSVIFGKYRTVKYTQCALTGNISAEVQP